MPQHLVCKATDKRKIKTYDQKAIFLTLYGQNRTGLYGLVFCELRMDKQDLQAGES